MSQKVMKPVSCTQLIAWLSLLLSYGATEACPLCHLLKLPNKRSIARVGQRRHHRGCQHHNCHPRCHVAIIPTTKRPSTPTILSIQAFLPPLCVPSSNSFNGISFLQSKRIRNKNFPSKISIISSRGCSRDDYLSSELDDVFEYRRFEECRGRHLIIFRSPSRHTYGFVNRHHENEALDTWSGCSNFDVDNINHDLAILEFNELLQSSMRSNEMGIDVKFIPVTSEFTLKQSKARQDVVDDMVTPQPQPTTNHSYTKANPTKQQINSPGLYWIELVDNQRISPEELHDAIHRATTRAILTHATFEIDSSIKFSRECLGDSQSNRDPGSNIDECSNQLRDVLEEKYDVIDTSNPNLSRHDRSSLIKKALIALESSESHGGELRVREQVQQQQQRRLRVMKKIILRSAKSLDNLELSSPVFICHSLSQQEQHPPCSNDSNVKENDDTLHSIHVLHFGVRIAIGPAGAKGAPSQTLRRTHRGILKDFALKNQIRGNIISIKEKSNISTAMEPEIGFLMANLALARLYNNSSIRVLDPCCGSGSLLLYSAALGATDLVGVDSDSSVWSGAFENFARFRAISGIRRRGGELPSPSLPTPKFYCGDVLEFSSTEVFCAANSFDAIVCDPPYNIGAPILLNGKDARPANYHNYDDVRSDGTDCRQPVEMNNKNDGKDLTNEVIGIARKVLRERGRIVFFIPVRSNEMTTSLADLLISRGCTRSEVDSRFSTSADSCGRESERLCLVFGRKQLFTPTFSRWLVCLEKRRGA